jgi:predicted CoA-binding protein
VGAVVVCVPPAQSEQVAKEVFEAGINRIWVQQGAESYAAIRYCENNGMTVAHGHCMLMFAEPVRSIHSFHRWIWKLIGRYPSMSAQHHS